MSKDTFYFSHDYNARNDIKIKKLIAKQGYLGYGIFWAIIEELYNNANALPLDYECIAYDMRTSEIIIKSIINDFDLFVLDNGFFGSYSVQRRLEERNAKSLKASKSANLRWNKLKEDANALQTHSEGNAIKESKGKEIKEINNDIESRKLKFSHSLIVFLSKYEKEMIRQFCDYWTEHGERDKKMRFEKEKSFDLEKRLSRWFNNNKNFKNGKQQNVTTTTEFKQLASNIREQGFH